MRSLHAVALAGVLALVACRNDGALPSAADPSTPAPTALAVSEITDAAYRGLPTSDRRAVTIGVLEAWRSANAAVVLIAPAQGEARYRRFARVGAEWRDEGPFTLTPQRRGAADGATSADLTYDPIAQLHFQGGGSEYMYHEWDLRTGNYSAFGYQSFSKISAGAWYGGSDWVADTLFEFRFSRWYYTGNDYYCGYGTKSSTTHYTSFMVQTSQGYCGATDVRLSYSIAKAYVR